MTIEALARETKDSLTPAAVRPPAIGPAGGRDAYAAKGVFLRWAGWSFLIWSLVFVRMMVVDLKIGGLPLFFVTMMVVGLGGYFASEAYGRKEPLAPSAAGCVVGLIGTWLLLLLLVGLGEAVRSGR